MSVTVGCLFIYWHFDLQELNKPRFTSQIKSTVEQLEQQLIQQLVQQRVRRSVGRELRGIAGGRQAARLTAQVRSIHDDRRPHTEPVTCRTPAS